MGLANGGSTGESGTLFDKILPSSNGPYKYSYDPATQTYKRLDEEILKTDKPVGAVESLGVNDRSGSGGDSQDTGGNYWAQREAEMKAQDEGKSQAEIDAALRAEQEADRAKFPELLAKAAIPGLAALKSVQNFFNPTPKSYAKSRAEMSDAEKAYADNTQAPVTDSMIAEAEANDAAKNAKAAATLEAAGINVGAFGGSGTPADPGFGEGYGYGMGFAEGGALRFAQAGSVPDKRIYTEPTKNAAPKLIPAQNAQGLAAVALEKQQLANQATQFVSPSAMMPQQTTFSPAVDLSSGYYPTRAENYTAATPKTFQKGLTKLQPEREDLPGGFSGYGDASLVLPLLPLLPLLGQPFQM